MCNFVPLHSFKITCIQFNLILLVIQVEDPDQNSKPNISGFNFKVSVRFCSKLYTISNRLASEFVFMMKESVHGALG